TSSGQLSEGGRDRGYALEDATTKHAIGKFNVECPLEGQHYVHARVRGHPRFIEIAVVLQGRDVHGEATMFLQDCSNLIVHLFHLIRLALFVLCATTTAAARSP